jgi:hypothetical protein
MSERGAVLEQPGAFPAAEAPARAYLAAVLVRVVDLLNRFDNA